MIKYFKVAFAGFIFTNATNDINGHTCDYRFLVTFLMQEQLRKLLYEVGYCHFFQLEVVSGLDILGFLFYLVL
ncbi:hypothetical protein A9486_24005 [Bacillus anthracis]|nr:hypothetical protein A9486_24005 [Bacillus anthracis]